MSSAWPFYSRNPITSDFKRYGGPHKPSTKCNNSPVYHTYRSHSRFHNFSVRGILFTQNDYLFGIFDGKQLPGVIATKITNLSLSLRYRNRRLP